MNTLDAIHARRSVRQFSDAPVSDEQIETLLRAAMAAPSAHNQQPWRFVVVRDPDTLARLAVATKYAAPIGRAQVGVVILADTGALKTAEDLWVIDCSLAGENLMLAACAEGLGSVWLASWPYTGYMAAIAEIVGAPEGVVPVGMFAIGMPATPGPLVDRFHPEWVHQERWTAE
jgi:nitroreductase